jgi:Putative transposase
MTLQTIPDCGDDPFTTRVGHVAGFSLHAGVATKTNERAKLERLCRYITRPAIATKRLSMTRNGQVPHELKTPWRNGTTHVIFEALDFMYRMYGMPRAQGCAGAAIARLVSLVPKPRINLTRFHGVFAPNSNFRALITPARRGKHKERHPADIQD